MGRYNNRRIVENNTLEYEDFFRKRNVKKISHYSYPIFKEFILEDMADLEIIGHSWKIGDRLYKLASIYYEDPELWWVIALMNKKPTEAHIKIGEVLDIFLPLEKVLERI